MSGPTRFPVETCKQCGKEIMITGDGSSFRLATEREDVPWFFFCSIICVQEYKKSQTEEEPTNSIIDVLVDETFCQK